MGMTAPTTIFDKLLARRDAERAARTGRKLKISEDEAVLETNRHGTMRWYLYPGSPHASNSLIFCRYEIPPGSRTGKQRLQGNLVAFALTGYGRAVVDGKEHAWEATDLIALPPLEEGHEFQVFNDSDEVAKLLVVEPNMIDLFGVDRGSGFEQLEDAPEEGV
ncbi:hypothetical protein AB0M46_11955 [Dactylosporangium sp. NPDC051485]|uniref:hypothetical protein n=1 Tax=Dactylosporangium sp. NPDC051485 TaxID=3154846 RepID=UPI00342D8F47